MPEPRGGAKIAALYSSPGDSVTLLKEKEREKRKEGKEKRRKEREGRRKEGRKEGKTAVKKAKTKTTKRRASNSEASSGCQPLRVPHLHFPLQAPLGP